MKITSLFLVGLLTLSILTPPVEAQQFRRRNSGRNAIAAAAAIGIIGAVAGRSNRGYNRGYYGGGYGDPGYSGYNSYGGYGNAYGYARPYGYSTYRTSYVAPGGLPFGATSFVDEGNYRNYRDEYGNFLGREPLF